MNELRRMAYLEALGVDSYISRTQLPGAALTRRLAIVRAAAVPGAARSERAATAVPESQVGGGAYGSSPLQQDMAIAVAPPMAAEPVRHGAAVPRFSLTAIVAGQWLWLEELGDMPLTREQVQLVQSMARALLHHGEAHAAGELPAARPDLAQPNVSQFDWPIHTNHQLDLGTQAARASVAAFVGRRMEQHGCRGLVLLGAGCALRVPLEEIKVLTVSIPGSAEILAQPTLKRTVWRDLLPLVNKQ